MVCQRCGRVAPTRRVEFRQLVGMLVLWVPKSLQAELCRACLQRVFWEYSLVTGIAGWWGIISFFLTPFYLATNLRQLIAARDLEPVPADAPLAEQVVQRTYPSVEPHLPALQARLDQGVGLDRLAREFAGAQGLEPDDVQVTLELLQARAVIHPKSS